MPKSIDKFMTKDLLSTFDPDIRAIKYKKDNDDLALILEQETEVLYLSEQDLVTLLTFLRKEKKQ